MGRLKNIIHKERVLIFDRPGSLHLRVWPLCILRCLFNTDVCDVSNPHSWQRYCFDVEWTTMCAVRACFHLKLSGRIHKQTCLPSHSLIIIELFLPALLTP